MLEIGSNMFKPILGARLIKQEAEAILVNSEVSIDTEKAVPTIPSAFTPASDRFKPILGARLIKQEAEIDK